MAADTDWRARAVDAEAAVARIGSGTRVFVQGATATPTPLIEALAARADMEGVRLYHLHLEFHPCDRTNDTALIRLNPKVVAINSAIEVSLSGQACADSTRTSAPSCNGSSKRPGISICPRRARCGRGQR